MKRCNRCGVEKEQPAFRRGSQCRACDKIVKLQWETKNRERHLASVRRRTNARREANVEAARAKEQAWRDANRERYNITQRRNADKAHAVNPEKRKAYGRLYRTRDREFYLAKRRESNQRRKSAARRYERERWKSDPLFRLKMRVRWFVRQRVKGCIKTGNGTELLGCSIEDFRIYLESKFEPGMSWDNYGKNGWHIDHIMPLAIFDLTKPDHQKRAFHFSNMQPLWAADNLRKSDKVPPGHQFNLL